MGRYPARMHQGSARLLAKTRRQKETIRNLREDRDALAKALRWMLRNIHLFDPKAPWWRLIMSDAYQSVASLAHYSGADPERLRELLEAVR